MFTRASKRRLVAAPKTHVLTSEDLLRRIFLFQSGVYHDMRAFPSLKYDPHESTAAEANNIRANRLALLPWYRTFGTSRLRHLFRCLPQLKIVVFVDALLFRLTDVLDCFVQRDNVDWIPDCPPALIALVVGAGHMGVLEFLTKHHISGFSVDAMDLCAGLGKLQTLQWLHEHRHEGCTTKAMDTAALNNHIDVVRWLYANRTEGCTIVGAVGAAQLGHLDVVRFFIETGLFGGNPLVLAIAAKDKGQTHVVEYILQTVAEQSPVRAAEIASMLLTRPGPA
ncbi:Aste57867_17942 [Aphanomyces stellatus]|uniref:Aste57867_17942 protein n=1 Tax=Aphanomyces stellatus TaxID=120398 RepID=A0A485L9P3_9STRA|nr:hypothetical protein As57867_017880 [Aphanomyces stellatus]VFT94683.1 Aste57867_17942 [Aphanomyces stellatus]